MEKLKVSAHSLQIGPIAKTFRIKKYNYFVVNAYSVAIVNGIIVINFLMEKKQ